MDLTTLDGLVALRKSRWTGDVKADTALVERIATLIVRSPAMRREVHRRPYLLIEAVMQVVDKRQRVVPFFLNAVQRAFLDAFERHGTARPYFVLKGRQQGFTTLITAMQLCYCLARKHFAGFTLADNMDNMNAIFLDKAKALYDRLPRAVKPRTKYNSRRELVFDKMGSSWRVGAAGDNLGRSRTLNFVHYSEVAFYRCRLDSLQRSLGEALTPDSIQIYETTANGWGSAKALWDSGSCVNLFFEWWRSPEYALEGDDPPVDEWLSKRLNYLREQGCTPAQCRWYARKYAAYLDKNGILEEYPCTADEAWVATGDCYFDRDTVLAALSSLPHAVPHTGYFECRILHGAMGEEEVADVRWVDDPAGYITLHEAPQVQVVEGRTCLAPYALGGDTAGEGSDWYAAKVVNARTGRTAATLHVQYLDDDLYARQVYCLGRYYHDAMVAVEVNFSLAPTRLLQRWGYPNLYMRERMDALTGQNALRPGFCTNAVTRPVILADLKALWRDDPTIECDRTTLLEMLSFVRNSVGRAEAQAGKHDDLVMSLAIAHHVATAGGRDWIESADDGADWIAAHFHYP